MPVLTVYTKPGCPYCAQAKEWLRDNECEFTEKDITAHVEHLREWRELSGGTSVPVIAVGKDIMTGFNPRRLEDFVDSCRNTSPGEEE